MDTPPRGLTLSIVWNPERGGRRRELSLGSAVRIALALSLCGACYQIGRWRARLEASVADAPASGVVVVERSSPYASGGAVGTGAAPGKAVGEKDDVITPLNVRDPTALVMGPNVTEQVPAHARPRSSDEVPEAPPPAKVYKNPEDIKAPRRF